MTRKCTITDSSSCAYGRREPVLHNMCLSTARLTLADPEGGGGDRDSGPPYPSKLQIAIGILTKSGTDPSQEALGPIASRGSNLKKTSQTMGSTINPDKGSMMEAV